MRRILFVDDDIRVLDGLRDLLRKKRKEWDMVFVSSGKAALAEMERSSFDAIVSDMRMPSMDGAALLNEVREHYPQTARIVLSGHADDAAILRVLPVAHQYLSKPCEEEGLRTVVERICALQRLVQNEQVRSILGKMKTLPSTPRTYWKLTEAAADPDMGLAGLAAIVEEDSALVAKVLQIVNSAYFGLVRRVTSIEQAVNYLGSERLKALALSAHVFVQAEPHTIQGFSLEELQLHSATTARLARRFCTNPHRAAEAYTAGMVHDVGKLVFAVGAHARFAEVVREARETGQPIAVVEKERMGVTHEEAGAYLLGLWGLPVPIVEAVAFHHHPGGVVEGGGEVLAALHVADALDEGGDATEEGLPSLLDRDFLARVGLLSSLPDWCDTARAEQVRTEQ